MIREAALVNISGCIICGGASERRSGAKFEDSVSVGTKWSINDVGAIDNTTVRVGGCMMYYRETGQDER